MSNLVATEEVAVSGLAMGEAFDLTSSVVNLPDLSKAAEMPIDLTAEYWTPDSKGETKLVFFDRIDVSKVLSQESGEVIDLECAYFLEQNEKMEVKTVMNGSKRLVGALAAHGIKRGTALKITYMGKKKNRNNSFSSDSWSIKPLTWNID